MLASPMMLVEGVRFGFAQSVMDVWTTVGSLVYVGGWMCSAVGLRLLRATGDGRLARLVFTIQMIGLVMAAFWAGQYLFGPPDADSRLSHVTDAAWPLSHLFMLVIGALVVTTGRLTEWRRVPPFLSGAALPVFFLLSAVGVRRPVAAASFGVLTTAGFFGLGFVLYTLSGQVAVRQRRS